MCAILPKGELLKPPVKKRKLQITFRPEESNAVVVTGNEDFTLYETYKLVLGIERLMFSKLVDKYERDTGDKTGNEDKLLKWYSKLK